MGEREEWRALVEAETLHMIPPEAHIASVKHLAARLLEVTAAAGDLLDRIEAKLGPVTGGQILVLRGCTIDGGAESLLDELVACARARGLTGAAAEHVPLVVCLEEGATIELLDVEGMRAAGWYRSPGYPVPGPEPTAEAVALHGRSMAKGMAGLTGDPRVDEPDIYDRAALVEVLVYHQRRDIGSCGCGWAELGHSHAEHVADVYEAAIGWERE